MAAGGPNKARSSRVMGQVASFGVACLVILLEFHIVFKHWWPVFGVWASENPIGVGLLVGLNLLGPICAYRAAGESGKQVGEEAEEIGRGINR